MWATANIRGGSEYGEAWHEAGMHEKKQNVFDDFIGAAEYLVRERYASPQTLGVMGGSNGGLLVGAVMEQRPDLFAVALPAVGVMDMLRYHKFTGGSAWATEYGSSEDAKDFAYLFKYSPLHNVKAGTCYPATLVTTADHDDRVVPSHSFKFTAALQAAQGCDRPVLIRVETQASHGYRPTDKRIAELADEWAFAESQHEGGRQGHCSRCPGSQKTVVKGYRAQAQAGGRLQRSATHEPAMISWFSRGDERKEEGRASHQPGTVVGSAIFRPKHSHDIREDLRHAVGKVVELVFTVAGPDERWAGQNIYMERPGPRTVLRGAWVADEDVQFIDSARTVGVNDDSALSQPQTGRRAIDAPPAPLVLVADDSRDTRDLYSLVLTTAGFQVIEAEDGLSALALARAAAPDAIVIDLDLPQMNGVDAIKLLRAEAGTSRTPILAFTACGEAAAAEALRNGADAHCLKPCFPDAFLEALRSILPAAVEMKPLRR